MTRFAIIGAGAVGSSLGAYLSRRGHEVLLVAREPHVRAIRNQGGLRVVSYDEEFLAPVRAAATLPENLPEDFSLHLTVQTPDLAPTLASVGPVAARHPVVTWQNGIRAEEIAAPFCERLYGGVVRFTSTMLEPGEVRLRRPGQFIVGRHPHGTDGFTAALVRDLRDAGFEAAESSEIAADKALKLLVNLVSGPAVLVRRTGPVPALARLQLRVLEEAERVFAAAGIRAEPVSGLGQPHHEFRKAFLGPGGAPDGRPVYNSTWQNLHHRRPRLENSFYHGEVMELGATHGVPTPVNARVLAVLEEVRERELGPEPFTPGEFQQRFEDVVDFEDLPEVPCDHGTAGPRQEI